ncbi:MAG: restriction endonuclease subunit S [Bacteroidaceae bacterium]|nr:restriction endonuclease subunit S [Bacteroidaceae bacterium]
MMKQIKEICYKESSNISQKSLAEKNGCYAVYGASGYLKDIDTFQQSEPYIGIVKDGSGVGRVNLYPEKTSLLSTLQYIKPKEGTNLRFLFYALNSIDYKKFLEGAAIPHIYFRDYGEELVYCPSLSEQTRIVSLLDDAFGKLERSREKAMKLLDDAKEIFQAQLKKEMTPKEGWEMKKLNEIAKYWIGLTYKPENVSQQGTVVLRSSNIQNGKIDLADIVRVDNVNIKEQLYVEEGDILMCSRNGSARLVGKCAIIPKLEEKMTFGTFMTIIRSESNKYLNYFLSSNDFKDQLPKKENTMINQITRYMLDEVSVNLPPLSDQQAIVSRLDYLSSQLKQIEEKTNKYLADLDELKQSLLKKAFEGKL